MCKQLKPKAVFAIQQTRIVDPFVFDIALFSAFKETDSVTALMSPDFELVTISFFIFVLFFIAHFLIFTEVVYWQHYLVVAWLVPCETAAISVQILHTPYNMHQFAVSLCSKR